MSSRRALFCTLLCLAVVGASCGSTDTSNKASERLGVYSFGVVGGHGKPRALEHRVPTPVSGIAGDIVQIASSNSDGYALTQSGTVWAWGAGSVGELGDKKTPTFSRNPVEVEFPAGVKITSLANPMPYNSGLAIDSRGRVWGWGYNPEHALCLPRAPISRPVQLPLSKVKLVTGAGDHALFETNGKVYACGRGSAGELGTGSRRDSATPVAVAGLPKGTGVKLLVSSWQDSGALMDNGSYYDWGFNKEGQLGDGTTTDRYVPVKVALPAPVTQVSQGGSSPNNGETIVILANGSVWSWGSNGWGQLGDGRSRNSPVPVRVMLPHDLHFTQVFAGGYAEYAVTRSGRLWAWGGNDRGQLGTNSKKFVQDTPVPTNVDVGQISSTATNVVVLVRR